MSAQMQTSKAQTGENQVAEAQSQGFEACFDGISETQNPYDPDRQFEAHCAWNDGWLQAQDALDR